MASSIPRSSSVNTFDHNNTPAAQQPEHSSSASAHQPMSPAMFERAIEDWVRKNDGTAREQKQRVADAISSAYKKKSTALDLSFYRRNLKSLPSAIGQLTNVTELGLGHPEFGGKLNWHYNGLTTLPKEILQLTNLTKLNLELNKLTTLPKKIGQLTNLTQLHLSQNKLTTLPKEIGQLTKLTSLYLSCNKLTTLPKEIGQLTKLTLLYLSSNKLTTLPKEIGQLTNLTKLHLCENQLKTLPPEIGQLTKLTELSLLDNKFTTLPISMWEAGFFRKGYSKYMVHEKGYLTGTRHLDNGVREEGKFQYIENMRTVALIDGIVTQPGGTRKKLTKGSYSLSGEKMLYKEHSLSAVAPLVTPTEPTAETSAPNSVSPVSQEEMAQWPDTLQDALTLLANQPADELKSFFSNDLGNLVAMPQLPPNLHSSEPHRLFFQGFTGLLNEHYFMLRSVSVAAIEESAPTWVQGITMALKTLSLPGTGVAGETINTIAQKLAQAHAETKARNIVQKFATDIHFTITAQHVGVLLTQYMDQVPEASNSFLKEAKRLLKEIGTKVHMLSDNPYRHIPKVLDAYTGFLKTVKKNPGLINNESGLSFQEHCKTAAMRIVSTSLGIPLEQVESSGSSHGNDRGKRPVVEDIETVDIHEVPSADFAENTEVQQLKEEMADLKGFLKQLLKEKETGGMALAQTQMHMLGVGGEVYAPQAESSTVGAKRSYSLQINELTERLGHLTPTVQQHEETIRTLTAPHVEFDNLNAMVTLSAHYLRRFGVINYANNPITVRLANGTEVGLAEQLERLHNKQPNANIKPYRPSKELQQLICKLDDEISILADLDAQRGQRILGGVVAKRTNPNKTHAHNLDVLKMVSYYLRQFNLVDYASGEAKVQLTGSEEKQTISTVLARLHDKQPRAQTKPYKLQRLLEELISELPDAVKNDVDTDLEANSAMLNEVQQRMSSKRTPPARQLVSLREVARERQQLFGE